MCLQRVFLSCGVALLASWFSGAAAGAGKPEDELAAALKTYFGKTSGNGWDLLDKIAGIQWAPLPPSSLQNCLPDGGCFTRQGKAQIGGRNLMAMATGARTIVNNLYLRNATAPFGESAVLGALKEAGFTARLARCPAAGTTGGTNWYKVTSAGTEPGVLSIQTSCNGRPCEGFVLSKSADLPALQPAQLKLYSEDCSAAPAERKSAAVSGMPQELIAQAIVSLIPPVSGPALYDWKTLASAPSQIEWSSESPKKGQLTYKNDPNPFMNTGQAAYAGRKFSILASGSQTEAKTIYLEEPGMHPKGEHVLGELYKKGLQIQLVRCGPIYSTSTNNWYSVKSANTHPVMLRQSLSYDGNQAGDTYELRLDNTLPKRDPRDRDPGVGGCR